MSALADRIDRMEAELRYLERELAELKRLAASEQPEHPVPTLTRAQAQRRETRQLLQDDLSSLLGARSLAWAGGAVTVIGVVFLFVLAVERGWVGEGVRVGFGAIVSATLFGAGFYLRRRYGDTHAGLAAAGAGIAGALATVVAASAGYHLIPNVAALALAAAISGAATAVAVAWSSELLALLGLVAAIVVTVPIADSHHIVAAGLAFVALELAGSFVVAVARSWTRLALAALLVSAPQALIMVGEHRSGGVAFGVGFGALALAAGSAFTLRDRVTRWITVLLLGSATTAGASVAIAYAGRREGVALAIIASAYAATGVGFHTRRRELAIVLMAIALTFTAIATFDLASHGSLAAVWAAEAILLAWLARRIDPRFGWSSAAFLTLAILRGLAHDARPHELFVASRSPAHGIVTVFIVLIAALSAALLISYWREPMLWTAGCVALYGTTMLILELFEQGGASVHTNFQRGHTAVSVIWAIVSAVLLYFGARADRRPLQIAGFSLFGIALAKLFFYDIGHLSSIARALSFLAVGALLLTAGFVYQRLMTSHRPRPLT